MQNVSTFVQVKTFDFISLLLFLSSLLQGAFWGILIGQLAGVARLVLDFIYPAPSCGEHDRRPIVVSAINFTYFSAMMLVLSAVVTIVLSFCTSRPDYNKVYTVNKDIYLSQQQTCLFDLLMYVHPMTESNRCFF